MPCPICDDTGWKTIEVDGVARVTRCECWHQRSFESLLKQARVPRRYAHCELSNFDAHYDSQRGSFSARGPPPPPRLVTQNQPAPTPPPPG